MDSNGNMKEKTSIFREQRYILKTLLYGII